MGHRGAWRPSGRTVLGGFGLLALVLTVGIMAMLAVRVLDSSPVTSEDSSSGLLEQLGGSARSQGSDGPSSSSSPPSSSGPSVGPEAARRSACATDRSTLELAIAAYRTLNGTSPPDQAALVGQGLLRAEVVTHRLVSTGGDVEVVGAGDCVDG